MSAFENESNDGPDEPVDADRIADEEAAAAAEAASIGGTAGDEDLDPALRPVEEAGGGVAEGFEQAEDELIDHAEHRADKVDPLADRFSAEAESDRAGAAYGDADEVESTEVVSDPAEGPEDPGEGPGTTAER